MGSGLNGVALTVFPQDNSNVYVGGDFSNIGGDTNKKYITKWDGQTYQRMGTGAQWIVNAISQVNSSTLYIAGRFADIGGDTKKNCVAKWTNNY
jgi:hypothetical protein